MTFLPKRMWGKIAAAAYGAALLGVAYIAIVGQGEHDTDFVVDYLMLFLTFPVGYAAFWLLVLSGIPGGLASAIVEVSLLGIAGYLQWFVAVPWLYRRLKGLPGRRPP